MTSSLSESAFLDVVADRLAGLTGARAVALGGSRAQGTFREDSDWDLAVYYRGRFDPGEVRALGWAGEVSEVGGWGGGVFNGGAWLDIDGRRVDVHYRDLDVVEHEAAEAARGRFRVEPLLFHLAGIPSYLVVAELAVNRVLRGEPVPPVAYPAALRSTAFAHWSCAARATLGYAVDQHARHGRLTETLGGVAVGLMQAGHAVLARRGEWVTNDKRLLERAGLRGADGILREAPAAGGAAAEGPDALVGAVERVRELCEAAFVSKVE
ncbi:nucleotidyltransferase domain-containing protein [Streptomyces sp. NPDC091279]|uniref:nucleotidyltransferase domain-containing protein n=1 Tax=Streptomyces sp. NPDC091279 TaxID=3365983 RepID=UPI00382BFDE9